MDASDKTRWTRARRGRIPAPVAGVRILVNAGPDSRTTSGHSGRADWQLTRMVYFREVQREDAPITVGRDRACDIVIRHATVSQCHCRIQASAVNEYIIEDCGSSNSLYIATHGMNDTPRRVDWERLTPGCCVYLGDVALIPIDEHGQVKITAGHMSEHLRLARAVYRTGTQICRYLGLSRTLFQQLARLWNVVTQEPHNQNQVTHRDQNPDCSRSSA